MDLDTPNTKTMLVRAAAELFAEHGYEGVSTRMIAQRAGVNLGGIHYHFGTKESLYVEAFRHLCAKGERPSLVRVLEERPELGQTAAGVAEAIVLACRRFLREILCAAQPSLQSRLIVRELSSPSSALPILVRDVFRGEMMADVAFYRTVRPGASEEEAMAWSGMLRSQAFFYLMTRAPLEMLREGRPLDETFVEEVVRLTARALIVSAGLPVPAELLPGETAM